MIYQNILRPVLFRFDSERVHHFALALGTLARLAPVAAAIRALYGLDDARLTVNVAGIEFPNRLGLAAGFDKDCSVPQLWEALGFGHIEFGTVTSSAQPGNPRPRIFRLARDRALINRMGFPSGGAALVARRIAEFKKTSPRARIGINLGKLKSVPIDSAADDYLACFRILRGLGDYYVLNVSSPNTPELRKLQEPQRLAELFRAVAGENTARAPLFVKVAPDLTWPELDQILDLSLASGVSGVIATNTTLAREGLLAPLEESGGLSGAPLHARAVEVVKYISQRCGTRLAIIGVGGVFGSAQVRAMLDAGASLVQIYTGLVYQGPAIVREIKGALSLSR